MHRNHRHRRLVCPGNGRLRIPAEKEDGGILSDGIHYRIQLPLFRLQLVDTAEREQQRAHERHIHTLIRPRMVVDDRCESFWYWSHWRGGICRRTLIFRKGDDSGIHRDDSGIHHRARDDVSSWWWGRLMTITSRLWLMFDVDEDEDFDVSVVPSWCCRRWLSQYVWLV